MARNSCAKPRTFPSDGAGPRLGAETPARPSGFPAFAALTLNPLPHGGRPFRNGFCCLTKSDCPPGKPRWRYSRSICRARGDRRRRVESARTHFIRLRYVEIEGQLRKVLTVVKMRGGSHSKDICEDEIISEGLAIGARILGER